MKTHIKEPEKSRREAQTGKPILDALINASESLDIRNTETPYPQAKAQPSPQSLSDILLAIRESHGNAIANTLYDDWFRAAQANYERVKVERDELLAALKDVLRYGSAGNENLIRAALAKHEGK